MKMKAMNKSVVLSLTLCLTLLLGSCAQVSTGAPDSAEGGLTKPVSVSAPVSAKNGETAESVVLSGDGVRATVPAGVKLEQDVKELTLTVTPMDASKGGIVAGEKEDVLSVDVHVSGVAADNTTPIAVELGSVMPKYLNAGNYELYHVEDGAANAMSASAQLDGHNEFFYDVYSGGLTVAMASFSEVSVVSNTENKWQGGVDTAWYNTTDAEFEIVNGDQLNGLAKIVSGTADGIAQDSFAGKTVRLIADVDLDATTADKAFHPIGVKADGMNAFEGTFDGAGHAVSNFYQNGSDGEALGLFACVADGTVKNLTIDNFASQGELAPTGCVSAYAEGECTFENIAIINCAPTAFNTGVAGIVGRDAGENSSFTFRNITVDASNTVSALWGSWDVAAAGLLGYLSGNSSAVLDNCHVTAVMDVYNDVCGNQQFGWYRNSGMMIGTVDKTKADGSLDLSNITATDCTVSFGDAHEYYYCEFEENGMTVGGDYRYSRVAECVGHDHTAAEDKQAVYLPFRQLFGGFGFGVDGVDLGEYDNIDISVATTSAVKFETSAQESYTSESSVTVGELFAAIAGVNPAINTNNVQVFVSPVGEESTAGAIYEANKSDWTQGTVTFSGVGAATVTITDYFFCTPTTINITVTEKVIVPVDKFVPAEGLVYYHTTEGGTIEKTLGEIFTVVDGVSINSATVEVSFAGNGATGTYTANTSDWTQGKITLSGVGTVEVSVTDQDYCNTATATVSVQEPDPAEKFEVKFPNVGECLYRVGNGNTVALGSLFSALESAKIGTVNVTVTALNGADVSCVYTANSDWTKGTLKFTGTGPVEITIDDNAYANALTLKLEVVNATNVTAYSGLGNRNSVLLSDITMSSGSSYYLSNATLYGNGFTFDMTDGTYAAGGNTSSNYVFGLNNANLDNVKIVGAVYTNYGATVQSEYNRAAVLSSGSNTITNSYIANCASAVRVKDGNLEIVNSTIKGGNFANIDVRGGHVILDNVTTINQVNGNDTAADGTVVVGLGVVVYYENVLDTTTIEIKNGITQYNHLSETQTEAYITDTTASKLVGAMFGDTYSSLQYNDGSDIWINTGIISMTENIGDDNISDVDGYLGMDASVTYLGATTNGYVYTVQPTAASVAEDVPEYATAGQGAIAPAYSFDYTNKNYVAKTDGSNDYCYEENGTVLISMDDGDTFNWDSSILTATKNGQTLDYTVTMDNVDYTGKSISFNTAGNYTVTYSYTDTNNYSVDENGDLTTYAKTYTKQVYITVSVIKASTKHAEFTFGSSGQATEKITVGNNTYISATGVSHDNSTWSYITVDGQKIYYPIVETPIVDKKLAYFYVFKGVVSITDYADGGTGSAITYDSGTTTMPSGLTVVKGRYGAFTDFSSNWSTLTDSALTVLGASNVFKYAASASASSTPTTHSSALAFVSPECTNARAEYITIAQYSYTDNANTTYYYYVGYHMPEKAKATTCVTSDTLITLADGNQKRIDEVTYADQLLVWDFYKGEYTSVPASIVMNHGFDTYEVVTLNFADGTVINTINGHGFYDAQNREFVILSADNATDYIGHSFVKQDGSVTELVSFSTALEQTESWSVLTAVHYNCILEGMLTLTPAEVEGSPAYLMPFAVDEDMKYDEAALKADVERYGLYTYEEFAQYMSREQFDALNLSIFKVAVGKGYITYEEILFLISIHIG